MKNKKRPSKLPEDWEVIPNTHEGIVTQEEFDIVQKLMTSRRKKSSSGYDNIFAGVIKCADCGYAMRAGSANRRKRPELIDCVQYSCNNYGRYGNVNCTSHTIEARDLINAVMADINKHANMAINDKKAIKTLQQKLSTISTNEFKVYEKEKRKITKRLGELDNLFTALYEDKVMERISNRNFNTMSKKYEQEQLQIDTRLKVIEDELVEKGRNDKGIVDFVSLIRNYRGITELTAPIINALIDKITIYYKFVGLLDEFYIQPKNVNRYVHQKVQLI
jgi:BMFP domain-containing protein YqiC